MGVRYEPCRYCGKNTQGYVNSAYPFSGYVCYDCYHTKYKEDLKNLYRSKDNSK